MLIRLGCEISYACPSPTPMLFMLQVHPEQASQLREPDILHCTPALDVRTYLDGYSNRCARVLAPAGSSRFRVDNLIACSDLPDQAAPQAGACALQDLPSDTLLYLLASRYCDTELLLQTAWRQFGGTVPGWPRVQAVCDFVQAHMSFSYAYADPTRSASRSYHERVGVCRDFAHLAIALCRCLNIPARYCTGYLGDIGIAPLDAPMDFAAWMEVYLEGGWYTFDPRNHASMPRLGRVLVGRGRDAADVALSVTFGEAELRDFKVWTDLVPSGAGQAAKA